MGIFNILENNFVNALYSLRKNKYINIMVVIALFLGLLFPVLVLCFGFAGLNYIDSTLVKDYERVIKLEIKDNSLSKDNISNIINSNKEIESISRFLVFRKTAIMGSNFSYATVRAVDMNYIDFNSIHISEGKWFNGNSLDGVCIIGKKFSTDNFKGNSIGESINLAGQNFKVIAVTDDIKLSDNIIIAMPCAENLHLINDNLLQYYVKFKSGNDMLTKTSVLKEYIVDQFGVSPNIIVLKNEYQNKINNTIGSILALLAIVIIVLFYSLLNTINIVKNKVLEMKKSYGIRIALGATNKDIYLQNFFELLILLTISSIMVFCSIYLISLFANKLVSYTIVKLNFVVVLCSSITCILIAFIMSYLTIRKVLRQNTIEILRG